MNTRQKSGFTLIELIVSVGLSSVIAFFALSMGLDYADSWNEVGDSVVQESDARLALDLLQVDIETAIFREGDDVMFAVTMLGNESNSSDWEVSDLERPDDSGYEVVNHEYGWAGSWLRFYTAAPSFNAVGYQIVRRGLYDEDRPRYHLFRSVARADKTFEAGLNITAEAYSDNSGIATEGSATTIVEPRLDHVICENVVDFGVRLYIEAEGDPSGEDAPEGLRLIFPASSETGSLSSSDEEHLASSLSGETYQTRYPDVVEVYLRVLDLSGAESLSLFEEELEEGDWEDIVQRNSKVYRRFINVRAKTL